MKIRPASLLLLLLPLVYTHAFAQSPLRVPKATQPVMIDGKLTPGEWDDANKIPLGNFARVYIKQTPKHVWLALELLQGDTGTLDLYLASGDNPLLNMHASAKLGERVLQTGTWPEEWHWWNNEGWVANVSRVDSWEKRTFLPENIREYQISRSRLPAKDFRLMFEIMTPAQPSWRETPFPAAASKTDPKNWMPFRLD